MTRRARAALLACVLAVSGTAACGGSDEKPTVNAVVDMRGRARVEVSAEQNVFIPAEIFIDRGTTVTWVNRDTIAHNIDGAALALDFPQDFGVSVAKFGPGEKYSFRFTKTGDNFYYTCTIHTGMNGRVHVAGPAPSTSTTSN